MVCQNCLGILRKDISPIDRPGVDGGSDSAKDDDHASAEEVPAGTVPRVMRLVQEARAQGPDLSLNHAVTQIGQRVGVNSDTLRGWPARPWSNNMTDGTPGNAATSPKPPCTRSTPRTNSGPTTTRR